MFGGRFFIGFRFVLIIHGIPHGDVAPDLTCVVALKDVVLLSFGVELYGRGREGTILSVSMYFLRASGTAIEPSGF